MASRLKRNEFLISHIVCSLVLLGFSYALIQDDQPYCTLRYRRLCQGKGRHVGCQYAYPGPGTACRNYTQIKFTARLKHFVIRFINRRRQRIAAGTERARGGALIPQPQIMMMVVWDRELALLAQRLADQCSFIHDDCRATVRYPYSGQTVGEVRWRGSTGESDTLSAQRAISRVFDAWWGERRRVKPEQLVAPFRVGTKGSAWGHFSQLAVWTLVAAGCGAARHAHPRRLLLVCDFSHTNMLGQSTLNPGLLAPCPPHTARRPRSAYPLLCAPTRVPDQNDEDVEYGSYEEYVAKFSENEDGISPSDDKKLIQKTFNIKGSMKPFKSKIRNATKPVLIDKLEYELEVASPYLPMKKSTRLHFSHLRENHEQDFDSQSSINLIKPKPMQHFEEMATEIVRQKWKHSRQRPRRPGADALLEKPVEKISEHSSVVSLRLDREDMKQLFLDTGFHVDWKKKSKP